MSEFIVTKSDGDCVVLEFENGLWIRGKKFDDGFSIYDMYYGDDSASNRKKYARKGFGTLALLAVKEKYGDIYAFQVTHKAEPFWIKMVKKDIVKEIASYW